MRSCGACRRACILGASLAAWPSTPLAAQEAPPPSSRLTLELGFGHEYQTSPLVQISPQGALVFLPGVHRLVGSHGRATLSAMREWPLGDEVRAVLGGDFRVKRSPDSRDLDFSSASISPALRWPMGGGFVGIGVNRQRLNVAGEHFRDVHSLQADWTITDQADHHWVLMGDVATNTHRGELTDLDSRSATLLLQQHLGEPWPGIAAFDADLYLVRESNSRGFHELSSRSALLHLSMEREQWGLTWSAGVSYLWAKFDQALLPTLPLRRDRAMTLETSAEIKLSPEQTLRIEFAEMRNHSNLALYENRYRQFGVTLNIAW